MKTNKKKTKSDQGDIKDIIKLEIKIKTNDASFVI